MSKTVQGLLQHCRNAKDWKYVYGMKGKVMTLAQYDSLKSTYGSMVWDSDKQKVGQVCCDCSGLISSYTGILRGSTNYRNTSTAQVSIADLNSNWKKYVGWALWMSGHIGVVSDTEGYYYAMDGSARNWSHRPLKDNNWQLCIKIKDIDYEDVKQDSSDIDVNYMSYSDGRWLPSVKNCEDYAGNFKQPIKAITMQSSKGYCRYRVHRIHLDEWDEFKTGNSVTDSKGYAGNGRDCIDGLQMEIRNVPGYNIVYRVHIINEDWLDWVTNYDSTPDGYAGIYGKLIDAIQIKIVKK